MQQLKTEVTIQIPSDYVLIKKVELEELKENLYLVFIGV